MYGVPVLIQVFDEDNQFISEKIKELYNFMISEEWVGNNSTI